MAGPAIANTYRMTNALYVMEVVLPQGSNMALQKLRPNAHKTMKTSDPWRTIPEAGKKGVKKAAKKLRRLADKRMGVPDG